MTTKQFFLDELQGELKRAFKWVAFAADSAEKGDFSGANYDMTVALQHWIKCQNIKDKYIADEDAEQTDWASFTNEALEMAKKEVAQGE